MILKHLNSMFKNIIIKKVKIYNKEKKKQKTY